MYKQFCKNLKHFIQVNQIEQPNIRLQLAKEILFLTDADDYIKHKRNNTIRYKEIKNFINGLQQYQHQFPALKKFLWELWAYGFDIEEAEDVAEDSPEIMIEKVKLIDVLLSTHYF